MALNRDDRTRIVMFFDDGALGERWQGPIVLDGDEIVFRLAGGPGDGRQVALKFREEKRPPPVEPRSSWTWIRRRSR